MALPTSLKLFIDTINGVAYPSFNSNSAITNPVFYAGDKAKLELYLIQPTDNPNYPKAELPYDAGLTIKAAVGNIDADPTGGTWQIGYGDDTTGELNYNATVSSLSTALNALASITADGGVTVTSNAGLYIITFNTVGAKELLTTNPSKLTPISAAGIIELQAGDANKPAIYGIHLQQTVVAYTNTFTPVSAAVASISELAAWNGSTVTYRLVITPDPKDGTYILTYNSIGDVSSSSISIPVDASSLELQNGLARGGLDNKVLVNQVGAYSWDITISLEPDGGLTADSSGIISYTGWVGELNFNTAHVIGLLNSAESVEAHLEVEITAATKPLTVLQLGCTIRASVIDEAAVEPLALDTYLTLSQAESEFLKLTGGTLSGGLTINDGDLSMSGTSGIYDVINLSTAQISFDDGSTQVTAALPLTGGTMAAEANLNFANTSDYISSLNSSRIEFTEGGSDKFTTLDNKQLALTDGDGVLLVKSTGITFPDLSVQSTAAVFSTSTQAQVGTSSTTVISPATLLDARYMAGGRYVGYITFTAATSGAGASATTGFIKAVNAPNFSTGYAHAYIAPQNGQRGQIYNTGIDFTKKIIMGVRLCRIQAGTVDANSVFRCNLGRGVPLTTAGDLSTRGIGVRFAGNTGALELQVHNGTTLYNVTSTFTPVYNQAFDVVITSDGDGLATLYVNGVSVATSTNAPTTLLGANATVLLVEAQNTAIITNSPMQVNCSDQFLHIPPV